MRRYVITCGLIFLLLAIFVLKVSSLEVNQSLKSADELFKKGKFEEAEKLYRAEVDQNPKNFKAFLQLGYIALLSNRLREAQDWLMKAIELQPEEKVPKLFMAEAFYRQDKFQEAAQYFRAVGREAIARKLESFKDLKPYQIQGDYKATSLNFLMTDPLPVIKVRANDSEEVNFLIDTGASEAVIDSEFAQEIGLHSLSSQTGTYAGGKKATFFHGHLKSLVLGDFEVKNVPVHIQSVRKFSALIFSGKRIDGIIGTVLFYHFLVTLDYPEGKLILRRKTKDNLEQLEKEAQTKQYIIVPFWMAGDHFLVAWGTVNKTQPLLFMVDTGLAGGGFTCPQSTVKKARIKLMENMAREGIGGGGKVKVVPFVLDELTLGDAKEEGIRGLFAGVFPLENVLGFSIGGIISHGFFRYYALTFDFEGMRLFLKKKS